MLSGVLRSPVAVRVNITIMRAFVKLRKRLEEYKDVVERLDQMEEKYDGQFRVVFEAMHRLMEPPESPRKRIGFET